MLFILQPCYSRLWYCVHFTCDSHTRSCYQCKVATNIQLDTLNLVIDNNALAFRIDERLSSSLNANNRCLINRFLWQLMTELTAKADANVKSRFMSFCPALTYRLTLHLVISLQVMLQFVPVTKNAPFLWNVLPCFLRGRCIMFLFKDNRKNNLEIPNDFPSQSFTDWR